MDRGTALIQQGDVDRGHALVSEGMVGLGEFVGWTAEDGTVGARVWRLPLMAKALCRLGVRRHACCRQDCCMVL